MAKQGTEFEKFTKELYEELLNQQQLKNLKVEHNVSIEGLTGQKHQIDVYWEFEVAGTIHKVAVECKDYNSAVSVGRIRDFHSAISDIGGIRGIFVTTVGYQEGAIKFARGTRIELKTIKSSDITTADFKGSGLVTEVHTNFTALMIDNVKNQFDFDIPYIFQRFKGEKLNINMECNNDEVFILDEDKKRLYSLHQLTDKIPREPENTQGLVYKHDLSDGLYFLDYPGNELELKINSITFTYDTFSFTESQVITAKATAKAIIRDILNDTCQVVGVQRLD